MIKILSATEGLNHINEICDLLSTSWERSIDEYIKWFEKDSSITIYIYNQNNKPIAIAITDTRDCLAGLSQRYLSNVCVHPDFRQQKIGKQLFNFIRSNEKYFVWKTKKSNHIAQKFYISLGTQLLMNIEDAEYIWMSV